MKPYSAMMAAVAICAILFGLQLTAAAQLPQAGCAPDGNRFDLEALTNAAFYGQYGEAVAFIPNRGGNGADLVVGTALDERFLNPAIQYDGFYSPSYYVQRDNTTCAADFEGGLPIVADFVPSGTPVAVADPAHDAFFIASLSFTPSGGETGLEILKSTSANLLNPSNCPSGTQSNPGACWPIAGIANATTTSSPNFPSIAVDQRISGTGAGDVYATLTQNPNGKSNYQITISACRNSDLACSTPVVVSGKDSNSTFSNVQVRPDGGITIVYGNSVVSFGTTQFKFVNCAPQGAPNPPTCSAPTLVISEKHPAIGRPGNIFAFFEQFPYHVDRLEADGKTVTSFVLYDQCAAAQIADYFCPKAQPVFTYSTDGGNTWSPLQIVGSAKGQQFLASLALDVPTGTVNIAYLSSQNDPLQYHTQLFLAQIPPGKTTVSSPIQITTTPYNGPYGYLEGATDLSVAAAGTGQPGQSRVYFHFAGSVAKGVYNNQAFPIYHNALTNLQY